MAKHYAGRTYVYDIVGLGSNAPHTEHIDENLGPSRTDVVSRVPHRRPGSSHQSDARYLEPRIPRSLECHHLGSAFVYCLGSKVKGSLIPLQSVGSFFEFIPARLGYNEALDKAVSCLCSIYRGAPSAPYNHQQEIYQSYIRALSSLREHISDTSLRITSETLCASILLQMCEVS